MLNRKLAPPFQKTISLSLPDPVEIPLASGVKIFILPQIQQNVAKLEVVFNSGRWFEPKTGLSHFTSILLEKGTTKRSAADIAGALEYYGATLDIQPGFDFVSVSIYSLKSQWKNVFPLFMEILESPSFPASEWELAKTIYLQNLKINNEKTSFRAGSKIRKNIFGKYPYGSAIEESEVSALNLEDFHNYYKVAFRVHSAYGVGKFTEEEIKLMRESLGKIGKAASFAVPAAQFPSKPFSDYEEKAGSVQSSIRLGKRSLVRKHADYPDFLILNHVLGGYFGSRLMKNIREEKGLTYGIYSSINPLVNEGLFTIGADVNKSNVALAIQEIQNEVRRLQMEPVDEQELMLARNHFIGSLQADMANLFSVIEKIKNMQLYQLSRTYYPDLLARVDKVTPDDLMQTAGKYLADGSLFEVVVG